MNETSPLPRARPSVAMTSSTAEELRQSLLRADGQEDLRIVTYKPSTGATRTTPLLATVVHAVEGETAVHGNVSFTGEYVLRALDIAVSEGCGLAIAHSHPRGSGWQAMSMPDADAEASYANLVREVTGHPLFGLTLAGADGHWSARSWNIGCGPSVSKNDCESVRIIGERLVVSWNDRLVPPPQVTAQQQRTVSCWGPRTQSDIARLRILVVGAGTLGLDVALRLAATGVATIGVLDFDTMKLVNLDRMIGPTMLDVLLKRSKVEVAVRLLDANATARLFTAVALEGSITQEEMLAAALDYDVIFCCLDDHPWPRSVLNAIAYSDLIPVIDGGIHIDAFRDGHGMRNATWRSHVLRPGRPCMACTGQLDLGRVHADREGLLDHDDYIDGLPPSDRPQSQNVAALAVCATGSILAQFVSLLAAPAGFGEPGPLRFSLSTHWLERVEVATRDHCCVEAAALSGDARQVLLGESAHAIAEAAERARAASRLSIRLGRWADRFAHGVQSFVARRLQ